MANKARGFVAFDIGGRTANVALGLGALAEVESAFDVGAFEDALDFGGKANASKLLKFVFAVLRGNDVELSPAETTYIKSMTVADFMKFISDLMSAGGMTQEQPEAKEASGERPLAAKRAGKRG